MDDVLARLMLFWIESVPFCVALPLLFAVDGNSGEASAERFFWSASMRIVAASCIAASATASARGEILTGGVGSIDFPSVVIGLVSDMVVWASVIPTMVSFDGATEAVMASSCWAFDSIIEKSALPLRCWVS